MATENEDCEMGVTSPNIPGTFADFEKILGNPIPNDQPEDDDFVMTADDLRKMRKDLDKVLRREWYTLFNFALIYANILLWLWRTQ